MHLFTLAKRGRVALAGAVCAVYLTGLGAAPLLGPDEPRYAQVAREMFARGDWVTPTLAGHTWFEKPALLYWMMMAAYGALGVTEQAARLGSALSGLLTVLLVWWLARRVERSGGEDTRGQGLACAAVMASSGGLLVFSRGASFDVILTAAVTAALACFFAAESETGGGRRRRLLALFYAGLGVALLAKGLVGLILPAGVVALYYLLRREWRSLPRLGLLWGPLVTLAVAAVWYAPVAARHGYAFVDEFFVQHHFARYASNKYRHPQPFYFYLPITALLALPWTAFLASGLGDVWRRRSERAGDAASRMRLLAFAWLVVPVAFFSLSGSKLPGYVLPALPGAALLAGGQLARYVRGRAGTGVMRATGALALALFVAGVIFAALNFGGAAGAPPEKYLPPGCLAAVLFPSGAAAALALFAPQRRELCAAAVVGATFLTVLLIVGCAFEGFARRESVGGLMRAAGAEGYGSLPVFQLHTVERTAEFYAAGRLAYDAAGEPVKFEGESQVVDATRRAGGSSLVIVPLRYVDQLTGSHALEARTLGDNGVLALVAVRARP